MTEEQIKKTTKEVFVKNFYSRALMPVENDFFKNLENTFNEILTELLVKKD